MCLCYRTRLLSRMLNFRYVFVFNALENCFKISFFFLISLLLWILATTTSNEIVKNLKTHNCQISAFTVSVQEAGFLFRHYILSFSSCKIRKNIFKMEGFIFPFVSLERFHKHWCPYSQLLFSHPWHFILGQGQHTTSRLSHSITLLEKKSKAKWL